MIPLNVSPLYVGIRNTILWSLGGFVFLILQNTIQLQQSPLDINLLIFILRKHYFVLMILLVHILLLLAFNRFSLWSFVMFSGSIVFLSLQNLFLDFNKLHLFVLFIFTAFSYSFYLMLYWIFEKACFDPNYKKSYFHGPMSLNLPLKLKLNGVELGARLTNWDTTGGFLYFESGEEKKISLPMREGKIEIDYKGYLFSDNVRFVSSAIDKKGYGFELKKNRENLEKYSWLDFVNLFDDLGMNSKYLR
jgi:hypothetical protein